MPTDTAKYLSLFSFSNLTNWSVRYLLDTNFSYNEKYPLVKIGSFLSRNKTPIDIENGKEYKRVTIKINNGGVYLRDTEKGENIGTKKQYIVKKGQFIFSRIDARNGAFGFIPAELEDAVVTNDFPVFDVDNNEIKTEYLVLITTTKQFVRFAQSCSSGTTNRQRIDIDSFLDQEIPLPSLEEQNKIVEEHNKKILQAGLQEQQAKDIEDEIEKYIFRELKVENAILANRKKGLSFIEYSTLTRWDVQFLSGNCISINSTLEKRKLREIVHFFNKSSEGKSIRISTTNFAEKDFLYIGMEHVQKNIGELVNTPIVKGKEIKSQSIKVPNNYFIYGKLRPYLNKYWFNDLDLDNIICSSEFFVFNIIDSINPYYFKYVISSPIIQIQIADKMSGARMPRINEDIFLNLEIPLPPLSKQNEIVSHIDKLKKQIKDLRSQAVQNREQAISDFEKEIFS